MGGAHLLNLDIESPPGTVLLPAKGLADEPELGCWSICLRQLAGWTEPENGTLQKRHAVQRHTVQGKELQVTKKRVGRLVSPLCTAGVDARPVLAKALQCYRSSLAARRPRGGILSGTGERAREEIGGNELASKSGFQGSD